MGSKRLWEAWPLGYMLCDAWGHTGDGLWGFTKDNNDGKDKKMKNDGEPWWPGGCGC